MPAVELRVGPHIAHGLGLVRALLSDHEAAELKMSWAIWGYS